MSAEMAKSHFDWITYNEPEGHLDNLVERLRKLPGLHPDARVVGLTYKDDSTVQRFNRIGYSNTYRYDAAADLGLIDPRAGLESIQSVLQPGVTAQLIVKHGLADLLLVRHVLEHAHRPITFLQALRALVKPDGYLLFEMPESTKFVKACDYSFVWEEHITYLSPNTLHSLLLEADFAIEETIQYPYPLEDSLIGIVKNARAKPAAGNRPERSEALTAEGDYFSSEFFQVRARLQALFRSWRGQGKRIALFGAGHLAAKFVNLYSLTEYFECVIDDNPNKQKMLMPGSRLSICGSGELAARSIDVCLLSLNPESEQKVLAKNQPFIERGGRFLSIFALSPMSVYAAGVK
ncbi:MAG: methyltransferase domain-containing protein [Burkholderiales bacterium]